MPRALVYAPEALADLEAASRWLTQPGSGPRAWRRLAAIRADIRGLRQHPCLRPFGDISGIREMQTAGGWRVLDEVFPDTGDSATAGDVRVLRVYGPGQDRRGIRNS
jgi:plasmid stabilization system protein ParE